MDGGLFVAGEFVFGTIVIVSNMKILISSYLVSFWLLFFVVGSTAFYILCYSIISSSFKASQEYGTFYMLMSAP